MGGAGRASDVSGEGGGMRGRRGAAHREKSDAAPPRLRSRSGSDACSGVGSGAAWKSSTSKSSSLQPSSERSAKRGRDIAGRRGGSGGEAAPQHHLAAPSLGRVSAPQLLQTTRALDRVQRVLLRHTPRRRGREHAQRRAAAQRCLSARRGGAPAGCPSGTGPLARAAAERALRRARNLQPRVARGGEEHLPGGAGRAGAAPPAGPARRAPSPSEAEGWLRPPLLLPPLLRLR